MNPSARPSQREADENRWRRIATSREFKDLLALKKTFILPAFLIFFFYYFALPIAVGFAPKWMSAVVIGDVTIGLVFALSQFVIGGIIAWLYLGASDKFDALTRDILKKHEDSQGGK
jgi:uncharacterized membrane protein (DUF485 family)